MHVAIKLDTDVERGMARGVARPCGPQVRDYTVVIIFLAISKLLDCVIKNFGNKKSKQQFHEN